MMKFKGFSLIELMIVVAIVAILIAIAQPSYKRQMQGSRRVDAQAVLSGFAIAMERYYTTQSPPSYIKSTTAFSGVGPGAPKSTVFQSQAPLTGNAKHYDLKVYSATASAFEIRAIPRNTQSDDKCGTLILKSTGEKNIDADPGVTWQDCWQ